MTTDTIQLKAALRAHAVNHRTSLHDKLAEMAALRLLSHPFPVKPHPGFSCVSAFHPYGNEIDTRQLLGKLAGEGWTTCLPVVVAKRQPLIFRRWLPGEPMEIGVMKIAVPLVSAPVVEPDVLLVPLLAFDKAGYRLGYGGGFYDATLAKLRAKKPIIAIGVAYTDQEVADVPHEAHDMKLDYIMTEKGIVKCV
jgi:5-formyltetrahydrofolate cyclo-ligase